MQFIIGNRSNNGASSQNFDARKPYNAVLTRSRKRKSVVLQDDDVPRLNSMETYRSRHSMGGSADRCTPFTEAFPSLGDNFKRKVHVNRRSQSRNSTPSEASVGSNRSYRRRLAESNNDCYETRSTTSSVSVTSISNRSSSSGVSYYTRRSSKRSSQSDEESCVSMISDFSEDDRSRTYSLRSCKDENIELTRTCTLPPVCFANSDEIWDLMCKMDAKYTRNPNIFKSNNGLSDQMRSILIDWLMDVCEAYHLHRETLYLAIDYLDRYLGAMKHVLKSHLQLLGITCLFVAAKLEEIYPPKLKTFAYVTDGACSEGDILDMELVLMKTLKWKLTPITPATWVNVFLQVLSYKKSGIHCTRAGSEFLRSALRLNPDNRSEETKIIKHLFDPVEYVRVIRLVDISILDSKSLTFSYAVLSASALYHVKGRNSALSASGFSMEQLKSCINWMAPAASILKRTDSVPPVLPSISEVNDETRHLIQSHCVTLDLMREALELKNKICSPISHTSEGLLTPPTTTSDHKYRRLRTSARF